MVAVAATQETVGQMVQKVHLLDVAQGLSTSRGASPGVGSDASAGLSQQFELQTFKLRVDAMEASITAHDAEFQHGLANDASNSHSWI